MNRRLSIVCGAVLAALLALLVIWWAAPERKAGAAKNRAGPSAPTADEKTGSTPTNLVVHYASPPPQIAPLVPDSTPVPVQAVITRGNKPYSPKISPGGSERIRVALNETVPIHLSWPDDTTHDGVFVQAVHGGKIDGGSNSKSFTFNEAKAIDFTFTPDAGSGTYELVLRRGTAEEALRFWVPTENPKADPPSI